VSILHVTWSYFFVAYVYDMQRNPWQRQQSGCNKSAPTPSHMAIKCQATDANLTRSPDPVSLLVYFFAFRDSFIVSTAPCLLKKRKLAKLLLFFAIYLSSYPSETLICYQLFEKKQNWNRKTNRLTGIFPKVLCESGIQ